MVYQFFLSTVRGRGRQRIDLPDGRSAYIRAVACPGMDLDEGLRTCQPRVGENFMNTHEIETLREQRTLAQLME